MTIAYLGLFTITFPANLEIFNLQILRLVKFEDITPERLY